MTTQIVAEMLNVYFSSITWRSFSGKLISKRFTAERDYVSEYGFENDVDNETKLFAVQKRTEENKEKIVIYVDNELSNSPPVMIAELECEDMIAIKMILGQKTVGHDNFSISTTNAFLEFHLNYKT